DGRDLRAGAQARDPRDPRVAVRAGGGASSERVVLGVVTRPHGVRGEVRVHRFNPSSTVLLEIDRVFVGDREVRVVSRKRSGDADVLALEGVSRVEDAEALRGATISVPRDRLPELPPGEHYVADLV